MKMLIDATALGSGRGGDETMLRSLIRGLSCTCVGDDHVITLASPEAAVGLRRDVDPRIQFEAMRPLPGAVHFSARLPAYLRRRRNGTDVVCTITHAPLVSPVPIALFVTDLSFLHLPGAYPGWTRRRLAWLVGYQAPRAAAVLTLSEFCRQDLIESFGLAPDRVHVVPIAVEVPPDFSPPRRARIESELLACGVSTPYLLYLGNLHPRKNLARTVRAFLDARRRDQGLRHHRLVVAGGRWWGSDEVAAARLADPGAVVVLGRVSDDMRQVLLEQADALVYLSLFEGFGLPPLEAMTVGTAVLAADTAAIPEVTGGAALLVDPLDQSAITDNMRRILTDADLRDCLVERGRSRVAAFTRAATGHAARDALASAIAGG